MFTSATALALAPSQKHVLESLARAGTTPQLLARKCRVILLASVGGHNNGIAQQTGLSRPTVIATRAAFGRGGVEAIRQRHKRKRSGRVLTPELQQKILDTTLKNPAAECDPLEPAHPGSASWRDPHPGAWGLATF